LKSANQHFEYIDALRAIAIFGVITVHTSQLVPPQSETLQQVTALGARGVQLFFIASTRLNRFVHLGAALA